MKELCWKVVKYDRKENNDFKLLLLLNKGSSLVFHWEFAPIDIFTISDSNLTTNQLKFLLEN